MSKLTREIILLEAANKCLWIANQAQKRKESQFIELGALRCERAILDLIKKKKSK